MILACHIFQYYNNFLAFHFNAGVYVFLLISGFIFGQRKITKPFEFYKKRFIRILIPYYILIVLYTIIYIIFFKSEISTIDILTNFFCVQWFFGGISNTGHLWYITCILICYLITPLLQKFLYHIKDNKKIILLLSIGFIISLISSKIFGLNLFSIFVYIFGYTVSNKDMFFNENLKKEKIHLIIAIGFLFEFVRIVFDIIKISPTMFYIEPSKLLLSISIILTCFLLSKIAINEKFVSFIDRYSYYFYLTHHMFILGNLSILQLTKNINYLYIIITLFFTLLSGIILAYLTKIAEKLLNHLNRKELKND